MSRESKTPRKKPQTVYELWRASRCYNCDSKQEAGQIVKLSNREDDREVLCRQCSGLAGWEVVPKGNAQLTRLAAKYAPEHFTIMKWSELWKCYERQGILVPQEALLKARNQPG